MLWFFILRIIWTRQHTILQPGSYTLFLLSSPLVLSQLMTVITAGSLPHLRLFIKLSSQLPNSPSIYQVTSIFSTYANYSALFTWHQRTFSTSRVELINLNSPGPCSEIIVGENFRCRFKTSWIMVYHCLKSLTFVSDFYRGLPGDVKSTVWEATSNFHGFVYTDIC